MVSQGTGIIFDNPDNTYFAGDTVSGRIQLVLDKPIQLRGIHLQLRGAAEVKWTEKERNSGDGNTEVRTVIYRAEEEYFKTKSYCVGSLLHEPITLPPGTHIYAFSMALPANVPSSFEGKHGSIRYIAKFTIETPWSWCQQTKTEFTVISPHDLTKFPKLLSPAKVQDERYYCCCCCKSVHQTSILMVPKTGYVSGEKIPFIVEVDNAAASSISEVIIKFQQYTRFRSHRPSKSSREDVKVFEMFNLGPVNYKDSKSWNQTMLIPPVPPSSLGSCSIIERQYQLCLEVRTGPFGRNLKSSIPITIGTVPVITNQVAAVKSGGVCQINWVNVPNSSVPPIPTIAANKMLKVKSIAERNNVKDTFYVKDSKGYTLLHSVLNIDGTDVVLMNEETTVNSGRVIQADLVDLPNSSATPIQIFAANKMLNVKSISEKNDGKGTFYGKDSKGYTSL